MDNEQKPLDTVEEIKKPASRFPVFVEQHKVLAILIIIIPLVLIGGVFVAIKKDKPSHKHSHNGEKIIVDGKEYTVAYHTDHADPADTPKLTNTEAISNLEKKVADKTAVYTDYQTLAQLYLVTGNKSKAIENYELAKKTADPNMPTYPSFVEFVDKMVKSLKAN